MGIAESPFSTAALEAKNRSLISIKSVNIGFMICRPLTTPHEVRINPQQAPKVPTQGRLRAIELEKIRQDRCGDFLDLPEPYKS